MAISVTFWGLNVRLKNSWILLVFVFVQLIACAIDEFTMGFLASKFEMESLINLYNSQVLSWVYLITYFGFMFFISIYAFQKHKVIYALVIQLIMLAGTILALFSDDVYHAASIIFLAYLLFFVVFVNRLMKTENAILSVISSQFLLVFLLEGLEYFQ